MKILLATDGSTTSDQAIHAILRRGVPPDAEVRVISVVEPPFAPTVEVWPGVDMTAYSAMHETAKERARAVVEAAAAKLRAGAEGRGFTVSTNVLLGSPKGSILEEADVFGADLIVVGSHGHGIVERFLLGSVSQAVVLHAKCSVEIVRNPEGQATKNQ